MRRGVREPARAGTPWCSTGASRSRWPRPRRAPAIRNARWPFSTKLWRRASAPAASAFEARNCIGRKRGDIPPKCGDPGRTPPWGREDAFTTAIALAERQEARGYALLASLSLAKLYQSTGRLAEAQAALAPALEGFSPTPEMPEIAEAQALLMAIEAGAHVRHS